MRYSHPFKSLNIVSFSKTTIDNCLRTLGNPAFYWVILLATIFSFNSCLDAIDVESLCDSNTVACVHGKVVKIYDGGKFTGCDCECTLDDACGKRCNVIIPGKKLACLFGLGSSSWNVDDCECACLSGYCGNICQTRKECGVNAFLKPDCQCECLNPNDIWPLCLNANPNEDNRISKKLNSNQHILGATTSGYLKTKYDLKTPSDYFPLQTGTEYYYIAIGDEEDTSNSTGIIVADTFSFNNLLMFDTDFVVFDSLNMPVDTTLGLVFFSPLDSANQVRQFIDSTRSNLWGFHHYNFGDTLFKEVDEYSGETYFLVTDSIGSVTVPAGTFEQCVFLKNERNSGPVYAPGVGLIKVLNDGTDVQVLTKFISSCNINVSVIFSDVSCANAMDGSIKIITDDEGADYNYTWLGPDSIGNTSSAAGLSPGIYNVLVERIDGCAAEFENIRISEPSKMEIQSNTIGQVSCKGLADAYININVSGGSGIYTYEWNNGAYTSQNISDLSPGNYEVVVTDDIGCLVQANYTISEPTLLEISVVNKINTSCQENNDGIIDIAVTGGSGEYSYNWNNGSFNTQDLQNLPAGTYDVIVTDEYACESFLSVVIDEPDSINLILSSTAASGSNADGRATVEVFGGTPPYTYIWNDTIISFSPLADGLIAGNYVVEVTDANDCLARDSVIVEMTTSSEKVQIDQGFIVFPNPVRSKDILTISFGSKINVQDIKVGLYNLEGRQIQAESSRDINAIQLSTNHFFDDLLLLYIEYEHTTVIKKIIVIND